MLGIYIEKHNKREEYKGLYSVDKKVYRDDGETNNDGFAFDKENLLILRAKITAILIDELSIKEKKPESSSTTINLNRQNYFK
jgi:hypothetical protein